MAAPLTDLGPDDLADLLDEQRSLHEELRDRGLALDLTRGKPSSAQLDLCQSLLTASVSATTPSGTDVRNYGGLTGLPELRAIFADLLNVGVEQLIAVGNSSLELMHEVISFAMLHGLRGGTPWAHQIAHGQPIRFLCPVPGYDRHFAICAGLGIEMIPVPMTSAGPDLEVVAHHLTDPQVKGLWAVPVYSNPGGVTYDHATVQALLDLPAADDFVVLYDNAYALHHLTNEEPRPIDVISLAADVGHPDRVFAFASTSKVTFAGAGVAFMAASTDNLAWFTGHLARRTIGPDKVNQLRHVGFFGGPEGVRTLMRRHRELLAPKFALVQETLKRRLGGTGVARWSSPRGGYFVTLEVMAGTAARVVQLAREAGVLLTPAGASHPGGIDPDDRYIRLAPSFPTEGELAAAMDAVATCVLLAAAERLSGQRWGR